MMKRWAITAALVLLGTQAAQAQMHSRMHPQSADTMPPAQAVRGMMMGGMMGQGMMGSGMMRMMDRGMGMMSTGGPGPGALLRMADDLGLTDEQREVIASLRDELHAEMEGQMAAMMSAHDAASEAVSGETPDWDAYEGNLRTAADLMVRTHLSMARTAHQAREVLTPEQRSKLDEEGMGMMGDMMHGMTPGHGNGASHR